MLDYKSQIVYNIRDRRNIWDKMCLKYLCPLDFKLNIAMQKNVEFTDIYNKAYKLSAAVFVVSNIINENEELKTRIKSLSLNLVSMAINLKDTNFVDTKKIIKEIEKVALELMSMLDIARVSELISEMNGSIIKKEFQSFIGELGKYIEKFETDKSVFVDDMFTEPLAIEATKHLDRHNVTDGPGVVKPTSLHSKNQESIKSNNGNGYKRKDLRKNMILDFIKGQNNEVSIKDIALSVTDCSEKTIQRELIALIKEGKIKKTGERRWSKYSVV